MTIPPLPRRTLLQSGAALAGPLTLAGLLPELGRVAPSAAAGAAAPVSGTLAGWVVVEPDRGATVRLVQFDEASRPVRQVAVAEVALAEARASLQQLCRRAHEMALEAVARSWGVPAAECVMGQGRISHAMGWRSVSYAAWVDFA